LAKITPYLSLHPHRSRPKKTVCAELGGVNPWIVVPSSSPSLSGQEDHGWDVSSLDRHARHLAFAKMTNNGHTCAAPQVVFVDEHWPHRDAFLQRVRYWLGQYAGNAPFYPGSANRHARFAAMANAETIVPTTCATTTTAVFEKQQYPILIPNVDLRDVNQNAVFVVEAFCPVLAEVPIRITKDDNSDYSMDFFKERGKSRREHLWVHSRPIFSFLTRYYKKVVNNVMELDKILVNMSFGVVGVNVWPALAHAMPMLRWGAPPGETASGIGHIGNAHLYTNVQKTILRAPFHWRGCGPFPSCHPGKRNESLPALPRTS
jgi:hypothetical protein